MSELSEAVARQHEQIREQAMHLSRLIACLEPSPDFAGMVRVKQSQFTNYSLLLDEAFEKYHCACDPPGSGEGWCTGHCRMVPAEDGGDRRADGE